MLTVDTLMNLIKAIENTDLQWIEQYISDGLLPCNNNVALCTAVYCGNTAVVEFMLPYLRAANVTEHHPNPIKLAVENNRAEIFDLLFPLLSTDAPKHPMLCCDILDQAVRLSRTDMVEKIVGIADTEGNDNLAREKARVFTLSDNPHIVTLLVQHASKNANTLAAVHFIAKRQWELLGIAAKHADIDCVMHKIATMPVDHAQAHTYLIAEQQRKALLKAVEDNTLQRGRKM